MVSVTPGRQVTVTLDEVGVEKGTYATLPLMAYLDAFSG